MSTIMINSILVKENIASISNERYLEIKKRSKCENSKIVYRENYGHINSLSPFKEKRAYEIVKRVCNNDLNTIEKLMFISNMIIADDESFAKVLLSKNYTIEKLEEINNLLKAIKRLPKEEQEKILNCDLFNEYAEFGKIYYGINYPHILINKSTEILTKKPKLLIK